MTTIHISGGSSMFTRITSTAEIRNGKNKVSSPARSEDRQGMAVMVVMLF